MGFGFYWVLLGFVGFLWFSSGFLLGWIVVMVLPGFYWFHRVLLVFIGFLWFPSGFELGLIRVVMVLPGFYWFHRVLRGFQTDSIGFVIVLTDCVTGFSPIFLVSLYGFYWISTGSGYIYFLFRVLFLFLFFFNRIFSFDSVESGGSRPFLTFPVWKKIIIIIKGKTNNQKEKHAILKEKMWPKRRRKETL